MKFNIVQFTMNANITYLIHDPIRTLLYALEDLGHEVTFHQNQLSADCINILVLGCRMNRQMVEYIIKSKIQYIVYQTEVFSEMGLNYFQESNIPKDHNIAIQSQYLLLLKHAITVWECFDFNREYLQAHDIPSQIIHHGYVPQLEGLSNKTPLYDVCFFGSLTEYRKNVLKELHKRNIEIKVLGTDPPFVRDELLRISKINLSIRANENTMSHIPHFRILTALYHNTITISEYAKGQAWLEPMMTYVEPNIDQLVDCVEQVLKDGTYDQQALEYKTHFQSQPMVDIMRALLQVL